ncbi:MAG: GNAT family N-acetyltransferase [Actinomycetales bacterium]
MTATAVRRLTPPSAEDDELVSRLTQLVNGVYAQAERGLWRDGFLRTTAEEMADMVRAGEIAVATREGQVVGSIRWHDVGEDRGEFGILAASPQVRGTGVGRALVDFAETDCCHRGLRVMQLELLVPRTWSHPSKELLRGWYGRRGYRLVASRPMDVAFPHLKPLLATPCDLEVHEKALQVTRS